MRDGGVEFGGDRGGAVVRPGDGRRERAAVGVDEHVGVDPAANADAGDALGAPIGDEGVEDGAQALGPVARILFDDARRGREVG